MLDALLMMMVFRFVPLAMKWCAGVIVVKTIAVSSGVAHVFVANMNSLKPVPPAPYSPMVELFTQNQNGIYDTLFTKTSRGSARFKEKMKERTAAERINNRILHNYGLENSKTRGKKRISFFAAIAGFNIHIDAQLSVLKARGLFDFSTTFGLRVTA